MKAFLFALTISAAFGQVPFVGCKSAGKPDAANAPSGAEQVFPMTAAEARQLAFYKSAIAPGALAPRGWHCYANYNPGWQVFYVTPQPLDAASITTGISKGYTGPVIEFIHRGGDGSASYEAARIISRVFPAHKPLIEKMIKDRVLQGAVNFIPYPKDTLKDRSPDIVEFQTPPQTEGLGTNFSVRKNAGPIDGVALFTGKTPSGERPDLIVLSVRLPSDLAALTPVIIRQAERDAESRHP